MVFTEKIYEPWMRATQTKKYEGIYMDFIVPMMPKLHLTRARLLDVGVGEGWFEAFLAEHNVVPKLSAGVDSVMHKPYSHFVLAEGDFLPFADEAFDIVVSIDTIHLLSNLNELIRVLSKKGFLLVSDFCSSANIESKRARLLKSFDGLKLLKEGVVGDERELDFVALFRKS